MSIKSEKEILDTLQKAYSSGDLNLALSTMDKDIIWDISGPPEVPYTGVFYGHDGFSKFWWLLGNTVEIHQAGFRFIVYGNQIAIGIGGECGQVKSTSKFYHYDWAVEYHFGDKKLISLMRQYYNPSQILAAVNK